MFKKSGWVNFLISFSSFILVLGIADSAARWWFQVPSSYLKRIVRVDPHADRPKRLEPNLNVRITGGYREFNYRLTSDANGFRNSPSLSSGSGGEGEVVFLGDSQTVGVGVDDAETYPSQVGRKMGVGVLNAACYGYSNLESERLLVEILRERSPRVVVLGFFAGNDPYENFAQAGFFSGVSGRASAGKSLWANLKDYLDAHSYIYNSFIRLRRYEFFNRFLYRLGLVNPALPGELVVFRKEADPKQGAFWRVTEEAITRMDEAVRQRGGRFVLLFLPDRFQVDALYWAGWKQKYRLNDGDFDREGPNRRMKGFAEQRGISFLDVTEKLRSEEEAGRHPYWVMDSHFSPHGNRVIAEALSDFMKKI
ncbi:MAG: hypothetical protein HYZ87_03255 [Candidatus Omnitrophica bacterium]|nr:hypothetical protein [Candidatus Omnitrophota bacterium]